MRLLSLATQALSWAGVLVPGGDSLDGGIVSHKLRRHIHAARARWHVNGIAVAIVTTPEYNAATGKGDVWRTEIIPSGEYADAKGNSVTGDSLFAIASNSKLFTALSIGLLIDNGTLLPNGEKLDWSTKIKDILPEWKLADEYASDHVDLLDLGSMRSGLPSHDIAHKSQPVHDMVLNLRNLTFTAEIRQEFQYNNEHYFTMAAIIPTLTNSTLDEFVQVHFFDPLGMSSTTYNGTVAELSGHRTDGFVHNGNNVTRCREKSKGAKHMDKSCHGVVESIGWWAEGAALENAGAGGIISSAKDISKWLRELLDPQVIPAHLIQKCATPLINTGGLQVPQTTVPFYGLGQMICTYRGEELVWHTGGVPGQTSLILRVPSKGIGLAILTNDGKVGPMLFFATAFAILDQLFDGSGDTLSKWEDQMFGMTIAEQLTALPAHPSPPEKGFDSIPGTYDGPGYGELALERLQPTDDDFHKAILAQLATFGVNTTGPIFVAPYDRTFVSHILLTPFDGQHFNWTATHVYYPNGKLVASHLATGPAVVTEAGVGMFGFFNSQGPGVKLNTPGVENVEEKASVWFARRE